MHYLMKPVAKTLVVALTCAGLAACGNMSKNIARDGSDAQELVWPSPDSTTPMHKGGTSPNLDSLRRVHAGMEKNQIANLIGYPHFNEGAWAVREWDYLFRLPAADGMTQCQYKILFDKDKLARSFYWKPATCADLLAGSPQAESVAAETFTLSADALFGFDSDELGGHGRDELNALARKITAHQGDVKTIRITGYTDALGSKSYNELLSQQRAHAVLRHLEDEGVPGGLMTAIGLGKTHPVKTDCDDSVGRDALVACLAPNRRVEVQVFGKE